MRCFRESQAQPPSCELPPLQFGVAEARLAGLADENPALLAAELRGGAGNGMANPRRIGARHDTASEFDNSGTLRPMRGAAVESTASVEIISESGRMTPMSSQMVHVRPAEGDIDPAELHFQRLKVALHEALVDALDLSMLADISQSELAGEVHAVATQMCQERAAELKGIDPSRMLRELLDEIFGLGPLEPLMQDPKISDILVNSSHTVYIERDGQIELTSVLFADDQHLLRIIQRIVSRVGRRIDEVSPLVDARLPDGSRVHAIIPPLALDGPVLSIRRFGARPLQI
jgi:hypothetical protein